MIRITATVHNITAFRRAAEDATELGHENLARAFAKCADKLERRLLRQTQRQVDRAANNAGTQYDNGPP